MIPEMFRGRSNRHTCTLIALFCATLFASPPAYSTISRSHQPDQGRKDATGAILVTANLFASGYFAARLGKEKTSDVPNYFGLALGAGSVAVALVEETSFPALVLLTGLSTVALSLAGLAKTTNKDASSSFHLSQIHNATISPLVLGDHRTGYRAGFLFRSSF